MVYCPRCGNQNDDSAQFCIKCGQSLAVRPETMGPVPAPPPGRKRGLGGTFLIALLALVAVAVIVGGVYYLTRQRKSGGEWIAYQTEGPTGEPSLWVVRPDGEAPIGVMSESEGNITYTSVLKAAQLEYTPFAPEGNRMLFRVWDGDEYSLYTYTPGQDEADRIVRRAQRVDYRFSSDGERIGVEILDEDGERSLLVMDTDGEDQVTLFSGSERSFAWDWLPNSRQVIFSLYDRGYGLFVMDDQGEERLTLTDGMDGVRFLVSSDGSRIARAVENGDRWDVIVTEADGSDPTRLAGGLAYARLFDFSPDGKKLLMGASDDGDWSDLHIMESDGTARVTLARDVEDADGGFCPGGEQIWFVVWDGEWWNLYLAGVDGEDDILLERRIDNYEVEFTPDGRTMIVSLRDGHEWDLYAVEVATGEQVRLINTSDLGTPVVVDNDRVLFWAADEDDESLYIARLDGEDTYELVGPVDGIRGYDISPDGRRVVYSEEEPVGYRLYMIDLDGKNEERLADDGFGPNWSD